MEWKPTHIADSKLHNMNCSNPGAPKPPAVYTFGHAHGAIQPACSTAAAQAGTAAALKGPIAAATAAEEDLQAAIWWQGDHKPTTNDARNSDIAEFWESVTSKGNLGKSIQHVTGKDIAKRVKEAGRGSHVTLGFEGNEFTRTSKYQAEFCQKFQEGESIKPVTADMYFQAKQQARSNKALGTGSSLNLSFMW